MFSVRLRVPNSAMRLVTASLYGSMYWPMFDTDVWPACVKYGCATLSAPGAFAAACAACVAWSSIGWYAPAAVSVMPKDFSCVGVKPAMRGMGAVWYGRLAKAFCPESISIA